MKQKLTILPLLLLLLTHQTWAQELNPVEKASTPKGFVAVSGGVALPVGDFFSSDVDNNSEAGFARIGYNLNLNAGYRLEKAFGIAGTFFYSRFKLDQKAIREALNGSVTEGTVSADHWQYWGIMAGPMATLDVADKVNVDLKLLGGYARANIPVIRYEVVGLPQAALVSPDKWTDAFSWQIGTNLRYHFARNTCLHAALDYNFMRPNWKFDYSSNGSTNNVDVDQKMGVIDAVVGIGVTF